MSSLTPSWFEEDSPRDLMRWVVAAAFVVVIHAGAVGYFLTWHQQEDIGGDTDVMTVELAPIDSTPGAGATSRATASGVESIGASSTVMTSVSPPMSSC